MLTAGRIGALRLLEDADLVADPTPSGWSIVDITMAAVGVLATGATLAAAIDAAMPVALAEHYVTAADVAALDGPAEPGHCGACDGSGEGATERHACRACRGSGCEQVSA